MKGVEAEKYLRTARNQIAGILKVSEKEIIFTSGGTESNNMAVIGAAMARKRRGKHIIATCFEHPSVLEPLKYLEHYVCPDGESFEITYLPVNNKGHISLEDLGNAVRNDTILVTAMMVNNETGAVQDTAAIGRIVKEKNPDCIYHTDVIQAFGKYEIFPRKMNIDMLSVSGHKFHGPKGTGFLYKNEKVRIEPLILGGGQQKGMRSGTDNVPGIAGIGLAAETAYSNLDSNVHHLLELKNALMQGLTRLNPGQRESYIKINSSPGYESAPHIVSVTFFPVKSEVMLHALEERGIYVSSGSACSSNKPGLSGTLQSVGLTKKEADCTIRFSFSKYNTLEEVDYALGQISDVYNMLKRFVSH